MEWMARHGDMRSRPAELIPGTLRVISVGLDYGRRDDEEAWQTLADGERAYVARYALGRDYHKLMRQRLQKLAGRIAEVVGRSEEHTSELQSLMRISYAVLCLQKKRIQMPTSEAQIN